MSPRRGGFTLIEMLVVLGLFGTVMAGVTGLLWSATRAQREATQLAEVDRIAARVLDRLTRDLEGCVLTGTRYHDHGFVGTDTKVSAGDADSLRFVTSAGRIDFTLDWNVTDRAFLRRCDLVEVEYKVDLDSSTTEVGLYRREKVLLTTLATDEKLIWRERQLAPEVTALSLRYGSGRGDWQESWDSKTTDKRPAVVEIKLEIDLAYKTRDEKALAEARERETEEGIRSLDRGTFYKLVGLPIDGIPKEEEEKK